MYFVFFLQKDEEGKTGFRRESRIGMIDLI